MAARAWVRGSPAGAAAAQDAGRVAALRARPAAADRGGAGPLRLVTPPEGDAVQCRAAGDFSSDRSGADGLNRRNGGCVTAISATPSTQSSPPPVIARPHTPAAPSWITPGRAARVTAPESRPVLFPPTATAEKNSPSVCGLP